MVVYKVLNALCLAPQQAAAAEHCYPHLPPLPRHRMEAPTTATVGLALSCVMTNPLSDQLQRGKRGTVCDKRVRNT